MKKKIIVFAANDCLKIKEKYFYKIAYDTGKLLAQSGFIVVTGGGEGLMNEVSRGSYENGGETIGIRLYEKGRIHSPYITSQELYKKLNPRQEKLLSLGDGYLAIPGGIGTFYEIFAVLSLKRKGEIPLWKPLILIDSYYQDLVHLIRKMEQNGFVSADVEKSYTLVDTPAEAVKELTRLLSS